MEITNLHVLALHKNPQYLKECCEMINDEWPRSETARLMSLQASCDSLPTSLILVNNDKLLGHCKLTRIPSIPNSCFIETVVIAKAMRGKKLGTFLMREVEKYCKDILHLEMLHLSTKGQEIFYSKLGYTICKPISIFGTFIPTCKPATTNSNDIKISTILHDSEVFGPPPPPPMPTYATISTETCLKTSKTFMLKYL